MIHRRLFNRSAVTKVMALAVIGVVLAATPALACAGLVTPGGNVKLVRTATLAAYHNGIEHYVTSFQFVGGGAEFGSIIPLPAVPSKVERGGDWTLQRLQRETEPVANASFASGAAPASAERDAEVLYETRIDALDITILKGGSNAVGKWAREHGFGLTPDAPEVLDFYARRSQIFMAARFNAQAAEERNQQLGDGTPIHLTIPTSNPWVPLRILGLGHSPEEATDADVYLLTDRAPTVLPERRQGLSPPAIGVGVDVIARRSARRQGHGVDPVIDVAFVLPGDRDDREAALRPRGRCQRRRQAVDGCGRSRPSREAQADDHDDDRHRHDVGAGDGAADDDRRSGPRNRGAGHPSEQRRR